MTALKTAIANYPHTKGLKDGTVSVPGVQFEHVEVSPIIGAFRRMCRTLEFDVCEMAITTYLTGKAHDKPFTALPIFVMRQFHHSPIVHNIKSGVQSPKDLEGKKVGVRAYTVTTGVWARGILATEYGVDLDKITWVVVDEEHVQEYRKPANVTERPGANLAEMLVAGELAAAIGVGKVDSPDIKPLIPDAAAAEAAWYRKTGIYPINHTIVVKDTLLQSDPSLAPRLFTGFEAAKAQFLQQLSSGSELSAEAQILASVGASWVMIRSPMVWRAIARRWRQSSGSRTNRRSCRAPSSRRRCSPPTRWTWASGDLLLRLSGNKS